MNRFTEEMKTWLFDLAHGNLGDNDIIKGFPKHYALHGCEIMSVQNDIVFHTPYGPEGVEWAMEDLKHAINEFVK